MVFECVELVSRPQAVKNGAVKVLTMPMSCVHSNFFSFLSFFMLIMTDWFHSLHAKAASTVATHQSVPILVVNHPEINTWKCMQLCSFLKSRHAVDKVPLYKGRGKSAVMKAEIPNPLVTKTSLCSSSKQRLILPTSDEIIILGPSTVTSSSLWSFHSPKYCACGSGLSGVELSSVRAHLREASNLMEQITELQCKIDSHWLKLSHLTRMTRNTVEKGILERGN